MNIRCKDAIEVGINEIADGPNKPDQVGSRFVHRNCFEKDRNYFEKELPGNWHIIHDPAFYNKNDKSSRSCRICGEEFELEVRFSGTPISATGRSVPPPNPPGRRTLQRFMDLNVNAMKWVTGTIWRWVVGNIIWDTLFGRRLTPAAKEAL